MLGLLRGTVALHVHDQAWETQAEETCAKLKALLGDTAVDVQHVGSTSVSGLMAKPILDIVIGVRNLNDLDSHMQMLWAEGIHEAMQDLPGQRLFVMGDFEADTRTHHIHAVQWNSVVWKNYIRFRDFLRAFEKKKAIYEAEKHRLAALYPADRQAYTAEKAELIGKLLEEANNWAEEREIYG